LRIRDRGHLRASANPKHVFLSACLPLLQSPERLGVAFSTRRIYAVFEPAARFFFPRRFPNLTRKATRTTFGRASAPPLVSDTPHAPVKPHMILKGNQRGSGRQLATQLLNADNNQSIEILELRGSIARKLHGAFEEWYACSTATRCLKYLYSLSINPHPRQGGLTQAQYFDLIERTEKELGLSGQPRAVVFHVPNDGREHCHVVWSRIDIEKCKAVQMSHDRLKLRRVAQEFARDHGITLPPGMRDMDSEF
jgi:Relaxase/Mobilisation nuclease domain